MISRVHRFHGHNALSSLYQRGRTIRAGQLSLKYAHSNRPAYRAAVVVSKKVSKSAVKRNRIRRVIYEQIRLHAADMPSPYDMMVVVYDEGVLAMNLDELSRTVRGLLRRASIIR